MHYRPTLTLLLIATAATCQAPTGLRGGVWKTLAPHIQVAFQQTNRNACTWRFRNSDDVHTLDSMHFSYTYSTAIVTRTPTSAPTTQSGDDILSQPLAPQEEFGGEANYSIPANCATVNMRVTDAKWL